MAWTVIAEFPADEGLHHREESKNCHNYCDKAKIFLASRGVEFFWSVILVSFLF
jgi:hypothetical protein